ncbi:MAG: 3-oxoacyl-ACP reductase FabG [Clostridia bacterium]|nr:3-oxoacyl-ACP reductase FabG [Clostridia bacterium]
MNISVEGKSIVITGSSRGIGRNMAVKLAKEGAKIVINYLNSRDKALELYEEIINYNKDCLLVKADVTKQEDVKKLCVETIKGFGQVDVLINNAGICSDNLIQLMTERQWKEVINVNLNSMFLCSRFFSKEMIPRRQGKIINISSLKGQLGSEGQTNYSASKAGVIGFTKALAKELGRFNISVNAVCPGFIVTDLNRHNESKKHAAQKMSVLDIDNSMEELLNFILYISSNAFRYVSGQVFNIDSRLFDISRLISL